LNLSIDDFTFLISAAYYPLAESCVSSLKMLYPDAKIKIAFDIKSQYNENRKLFFENFNNIEIVDNIFNKKHHGQLERLVCKVKTPYFITLDDDVFFHSFGVMEFLIDKLKQKDYHAIGWMFGPYTAKDRMVQWITSNRLHVYFLCLKTETYFNYGMKLSSRSKESLFLSDAKYYAKNYIFYDTGAFITCDLLKNNLDFLDIKNGFSPFLRHYGASCFWLKHFEKFNISEKAFANGIFLVNKEMVDYEKYNETNLRKFNLFLNDLEVVIRNMMRDNRFEFFKLDSCILSSEKNVINILNQNKIR